MEMVHKLTVRQLDRLSEIIGNLGLLVFGTIVLQPTVTNQPYNLNDLVPGITVSISCIMISILLLNKRR